MRKMYHSVSRACILMMLLLGYVAGLRAASFTYTLTTHTDGRTITGTANLAEGASLEDNMPQALWRAFCTYTYYSDAEKTIEITTAPSSSGTIYVDYVFDPPFFMSEEGGEPIWHYLRTYNAGGTNNHFVFYRQNEENTYSRQTIRGYQGTTPPAPSTSGNATMTKKGHAEWAFYGDAYDFRIKVNDPDIANPWMVWTGTSGTKTIRLGSYPAPGIGWQLYVNTATNNRLKSGTMALGVPGVDNYLANLDNLTSYIPTQSLDTSRQFFDSHNRLVHKTGESSSGSYQRNLWWYAFFATPVSNSPTTTDIWHITYKIIKAYDYNKQRGDNQIAQKPQNTEIIHDARFNTSLELDGCSYTFYKDAKLTEMYGESETLPLGCNSVVYVKESCPQTDHWVTMVSPFTIDDVTQYFGSRDDGKTPAASVLEYTSVATTDNGNDMVSVHLTFTETTTMEANKPYLIKFDEVGTVMLAKQEADKADATASESDLEEVTFFDSNVPNVNVTMKGTYEGVTLTPQSTTSDPAYFYFGYNSKYDPESADYDEEAAQGKLPYNFYKVKSKNAVISPYRCYFYATGTNSLVNLSMMNMTDGIGEVMDEVVVHRPAMGVYNLKGQKLRGINTMEGLPAGIYIVNGKKLVVK